MTGEDARAVLTSVVGHYPEYSVSQDQGQREGSARTRGTDIPNPNLDRRRTFEQQ